MASTCRHRGGRPGPTALRRVVEEPCFTNRGALNSPPYTRELLLYGKLVNAAGAMFNMSGAGGYGGNLYLGRAGTAIYNRATLAMATAFVGLLSPHQGFYNTGTILFGVDGDDWGSFGLHSRTQATGGYGRVVIDGAVEPVFADGKEPAELSPPSPPWPPTAKSIVYQMVGGGGGQPGVFNISCAAPVTGHWALSCPNPHHPASQGGDTGQAVLTVNSASTLDPTATTLASKEPVAGYRRAFTSHHGQSVRLGGGQFLGVVPVSTVPGATQAVLRTTALLPSADNVVAIYLGDNNYVLSISPSVTDTSSPPVRRRFRAP